MNQTIRVGVSLILGAATGCGGASRLPDGGPPPPHQGNLVRLPGSKQYVEVVQKKAGSPTTPMTGEVSFYFLNEDGTTPISPAPTNGSLEVGKKKIALKPEGDALVTPSGPPLLARSAGVDGVLSVELDGKTVNVPLGLR